MSQDGIPYILFFLTLALLAALGAWLGNIPYFYLGAALSLLTAGFMAYFFRDPERDIPLEPGLIVSPADGKVTRVETLLSDDENSATLISIFLSPLDVHINRAPISGVVTDVNYLKGKFLIATNEESSLLNEQNSITIKGEGIVVVCKQIAGIVARRIVCWKKQGDSVTRGERFGLIKFSSRTDIILPAETEVLVKVGMRVKGGTTILGRHR